MSDLVQASTLLSVIGNGANKVSEIASRVNKDSSSLAGPLKKLLNMQLVEREVPFGENLKDSKRSLYHLSDPYMQFYYRFISSNRSFIELGRTEMVMNIIRAEKVTYVGYMWERLARRSVSGQTIEGITFGMASRWWGGVSKSESIELDVIAESLDKKTLLVGECKWTSA
jgi:AAA+ ATPase superfamily predicted ATPase